MKPSVPPFSPPDSRHGTVSLPNGSAPAVPCDATLTYIDAAGAVNVCPVLDAQGVDLAAAHPRRKFHSFHVTDM
jgi:hypothetical protein